MFLNYFFPVYADSVGYSSADSSRRFMIYGICIIYLGPIITKFVTKHFGSKISTILYVVLTISGLAVFAITGTNSSAVAAVILLSLSESFGIITAVNYFVGLRASRELGEGMALGFYGLAENVGQVLGPIIFGIPIMFGYSKGVGILAMSTAFMLLLFIILSAKGERRKPEDSDDDKMPLNEYGKRINS